MKTGGAVVLLALLGAMSVPASGPLGIYGIIEKVVVEPDEKSPERIQVWGAFMYVDGPGTAPGAVSPARRGYLYFSLPQVIPGFTSSRQIELVRNEWADLKAMAGTGQAVGFGRWGYIASFDSLHPDRRPAAPSVILHAVPGGGSETDLRVRPAAEPPASPAVYQTNVGVVKLSEQGSHAAVVKQLKDALKR